MSLSFALAASGGPGCRDAEPPAPAPAARPAAPPAPRAQLAGLQGEVMVKRVAGDEWVRAREGLPLGTGDKVATGTGARAQLRFATGGSVTLGSNALVALSEPPARPGRPPADVTVLQGRVDAELTGPETQTLSVETPEAAVRAGREVVFQ